MQRSQVTKEQAAPTLIYYCVQLHSVWVLQNVWLNFWTLLWAAKIHCFRWALGWCPAGSEGFDFPLSSRSSPPILTLPTYHWGYLSFRSANLLPSFFSFWALGLLFPTASTLKLIGPLLLQVTVLSPVANYDVSVHVTNITPSHTSRHRISSCAVVWQLCGLPIQLQ